MFKKILLSGLVFASSFVAVANTTNHLGIDDDKKNTPVDYPVDMEINYDELLNNWIVDKSTTIECDYNKQAAVLFDDSIYMQRLYALPTQMELAYNDIVKRFIEMYADRRRSQVSYMLGQGAYYFPMFEEALDKEGLPLELKYLPVIESALNPVAKSRVGATGLWQFMAPTGKMYKLEINSLVDERRDPYKSTQAAVRYLKDMYRIYQDWNLVIAAYNCGPGNVNKAIRRSGGKRDYWDIYPYLPKETRGYVPAFIAATYIMSYYPQHNICPAETDLPVLVDTLSINKMVHLEQIADIIKVPIDDIRKLNPQFKEDIIPGEHRAYALKLPLNNLTAFIDNEATIYAHRAEELLTHKRIRSIASSGNVGTGGGYATHKVTRGETLGAIAMRYRVSVAQIKNWNGMKSDKLSIGNNLKVSAYIAPQKVSVPTVTPRVVEESVSELIAEDGVLKRSTTVTKNTISNYKVVRGDTWQGIANKTGASIANIKKWNGIKNNSLVAGRSFKIHKTEVVEDYVEVSKPEESTIDIDTSELVAFFDMYAQDIRIQEPTISMGLLLGESPSSDRDYELDESTVIYHKVIYGETISQIAAKYDVTVDDILAWNNITRDTSDKVARLLIILPKDEVDTQIAKSEPKEEGKTAQL